MNLPSPTALGVKALLFYGLLVGAFFAAPYANLFFLLVTFLTVLALLSLFWTARHLTGVRAGFRALEPVPTGQEIHLEGWIDGGRRVRFAVRLEVELEGRGWVSIPCEAVQGRQELCTAIPALPRGRYAIRSGRMVSTWPLGFLRSRREVEAPEELLRGQE